MPTVFQHLPNLLAKVSSLHPTVHVSQGLMGLSLVMDIPSVWCKVHLYLTDTLYSLILELSS